MRRVSGDSRRDFLAFTSASLAALAIRQSGTAAESVSCPNVLFLISDEHAPTAMRCAGNPAIYTPALDALAAAGLRFTSAYCQNPICVPSRASFLTGKMPSHVGVFGNDAEKAETIKGALTLATIFREAGYQTEWLGKTHWGAKNEDLGFGTANDAAAADRKKRCKAAKAFRNKIGRLPQDAAVSPFPVEEDDDFVTTDHAIRFLEAKGNKPFLLGVSFRKPHFPFEVQQSYFDRYKGAIDAPHVHQAMLDDLCLASAKEREKFKFAELTKAQTRRARAMYYGMVTYIDELVGRVVKKLDELGLRENTIIIYTADHGELAGEHGLWYKNSFYEASAAVPFIWSFPKRLPANKKITAHVMNMDIFPTLCELCGIARPEGLEGTSIVSLMLGREDGKDRIALSENFRGSTGGRMVRKGDWKYCWYTEGRAQLYNLADDPAEARNLINEAKHLALIAELHDLALDGFIPKPKA